MDKLVEILDYAFEHKEDLSPSAGAAKRRALMDKIRESFPELEKKDCQSSFTCFMLLISKLVSTKKEAERVFPRFKKIVPFLYKATSYNSAEIAFGKIRKAMENKSDSVKQYADSTFKTTQDEKNTQSAVAQQRAESKMADPVRTTLPNVLEHIARDIETKDFARVMSALEISSGSRSIELLNPTVSQFKASSTPGYVVQTGQAKSKKNKESGERIQTAVEKPIIGTTVDKWLSQLQFIRTYTAQDVKAGRTNAEIGNKYQPAITEYIKEIYPTLKKNEGGHKLRAIYSKASYEVHNPNGEVSPQLWAKTVLGHGSYSSLKNYDSVIVSRGPQRKPEDANVMMTELESRLKALEGRGQEAPAAPPPQASGDVLIPKPRRKAPKATETHVRLPLASGEGSVDLPRVRHRRNKTEADKKALILDAEELLEQNGVNVTNAHLRLLGISSSTVNIYRTGSQSSLRKAD